MSERLADLVVSGSFDDRFLGLLSGFALCLGTLGAVPESVRVVARFDDVAMMGEPIQ